MATRTKQGFEDLGREHAKNGDVRRYKVADASWQARAYSTGWDIGKGELNAEAQPRNSGQTTFKAAYVGSIRPPGNSIVNRVAIGHAVVIQPKKPKGEGAQIWFDELHHKQVNNLHAIHEENKTINLALIAGQYGWPVAAREHLRQLVAEFKREEHPPRRARLVRAVVRLLERHGASV